MLPAIPGIHDHRGSRGFADIIPHAEDAGRGLVSRARGLDTPDVQHTPRCRRATSPAPSGTAFLAMLPMALAGGSSVSSFPIPMLFGIVICASSSVFIAAPILLFLGEGRLRTGRGSRATEAAITAELQRVEDPAA